MRRAFPTPVSCLLALAPMLVACTLVSDLDIKQCTKDGDCAKYGVRYANYACEREVCVPFGCTSSTECQARGAGYEGYLCENQSCVAPDCLTNEECTDESPTSSCSEGRCADPQWGCLRTDDGPAASPETLKFRAPVLDFLSRVTPEGMEAVVCRRADPNCDVPAAGPYMADGEGYASFTLTDVPSSGFDGFIRFTAEGNLPLEFQFASPLVHDFEADESTPLVMLRPGTITSFGNLVGMEFDEETSALMTMRVYDCAGKPAPGVYMSAMPAAKSLFYSADSTFVPNIEAPATDENGIGGLANLPPGIPTITVTHVATQSKLFDFSLLVHAKTLVLVFARAEDL